MRLVFRIKLSGNAINKQQEVTHEHQPLLDEDRKLLHEKSIKIQKKTFELFNYNNTMKKIFEFIEQ